MIGIMIRLFCLFVLAGLGCVAAASDSGLPVAVLPFPRQFKVTGGRILGLPVVDVHDMTLPIEGYRLSVSAKGITIASSDARGAFYARQTLRQLTNNEGVLCCEVKDWPEYAYRGLMIDEGRHFFGKAFVLRTLELMARYKLNKLHWHLTEDQGWRIAIDRYPELTKIGATRVESAIRGRYHGVYDGTPYGPYFYTKDEIREVVKRAAELKIDIIPEIEMPGHCRSVIAAYPELACPTAKLGRRTCWEDWGICDDVVCAANPKVVEFYKNVIDEVCELFPGEVINTGGDEVTGKQWKACPVCQAKMKELGFADVLQLQGWFTMQIYDYVVNVKKRTFTGFSDILQNGTKLDPSKVYVTGGCGNLHLYAAYNGYKAIAAPVEYAYWDQNQGLDDADKIMYSTWYAGCVTLGDVYAFDPRRGLIGKARDKIFGAEAQNWAEYSYTVKDLEWKMWPRAIGLAQALWNLPSGYSYREKFLPQVKRHIQQLRAEGVNCADAYEGYLCSSSGGSSADNQVFTREAVVTAKPQGVRLFLAGASTLEDGGQRPGLYPYASWGRELEFSMKTGNDVVNFAVSGHSTKSFEADGHWAKLIAEVRKDDYVAMQFGHNDQKRSTPYYREKRWCDPKGAFRENIRRWVGEVRAKGAHPILMSPICRCTFDAEGKRLVDREHASDGVCLRSYRDAMKELSEELGCDYVDMNGLTRELYEKIGKTEAEKLFVISTKIVKGKDGEPAKDTTHPCKTGALELSRLFIEDVRRRGLPIAQLFRTAEFPITAFGARDDGSVCTEAFAKAFAAAEAAGGGRVVVPPGRWTSGAIRFRSRCELHLAEGSEILFTQNPQDYLPAVRTSWEGTECWNYCPLVYAYGCTNVAITGSGTLRAYEGDWKQTVWYGWVFGKGIAVAREQLCRWGATDFPVDERQLWDLPESHARPHFVHFNRCQGVRWEGFKVRNSPFWTLHLYMCRDAAVRGLDVSAHGNNNDGIDIEMSKNVLIERCRFDQGDDGIVIKAGRNRDGWRLATPTENVLVRDCEVTNGHSLLAVGSEVSGGIRNVRLLDCTGGDISRVVFVKTNPQRGGFVEGVHVDGVAVATARTALISISADTYYENPAGPCSERYDTRISDISVKNVKCAEALRRLDIIGSKDLPAEKIWVANVACGYAKELDRIENIKEYREE